MAEYRVGVRTQRGSRLKVGGLSAPISILIAYAVHQLWGTEMSTEVTIAVSSLVSSIVTVFSLCFWDIRALLLERYRARRLEDKA